MEKKKVIVWFDDDAVRYRLLMQEVEKAGYVVYYVSDLKKCFKIVKLSEYFSNCALIIIEPVHFFGMAGRPMPKSLIYYIRHYAKCDAPIMFYTLSSQDIKKMLEEYKDYGVVKILSKFTTLPSEIRPVIEEVLALRQSLLEKGL